MPLAELREIGRRGRPRGVSLPEDPRDLQLVKGLSPAFEVLELARDPAPAHNDPSPVRDQERGVDLVPGRRLIGPHHEHLPVVVEPAPEPNRPVVPVLVAEREGDRLGRPVDVLAASCDQVFFPPLPLQLPETGPASYDGSEDEESREPVFP